jgi:hypothetical protein
MIYRTRFISIPYFYFMLLLLILINGCAIGLDVCRFPICSSSLAFVYLGNLLYAAGIHSGFVCLPTPRMAHSTLAVVLLAVVFVVFPKAEPKATPPIDTSLEASVQSVPSLALDLFAEEATADAASQIFAAPLFLRVFALQSLALYGSVAHCCCHILCNDSDRSAGDPQWIVAARFPQ